MNLLCRLYMFMSYGDADFEVRRVLIRPAAEQSPGLLHALNYYCRNFIFKLTAASFQEPLEYFVDYLNHESFL